MMITPAMIVWGCRSSWEGVGKHSCTFLFSVSSSVVYVPYTLRRRRQEVVGASATLPPAPPLVMC